MSVKTYSLAKNGDEKLSTNFTVKEFKCKDGSDTILIDDTLVSYLQKIRDWAGAPVTITSGYRTSSYNATLPGAAKDSYHIKGQAADIVVSGKSTKEVYDKAINLGMKGVIRYISDGFVHVDTRNSQYHATVE